MRIEKLTIKAFEKPGENGEGENEVAGSPYQVMINPENINLNKSVTRNSDEKPQGKKEVPSLGAFSADSLNFDLVFDGTGLVSEVKYIQEEIQHFEKLVYQFQNQTHNSNFLEIKWGQFVFRGYLNSIQINYTLFDSEGNALRAKVSVSFEGYIPPVQFAKNPGQSSPDRTHLKFPDASDSLTKYCNDIYGDPKYIIQVARVNKLVNFRKLKLGKRLTFPPLTN